MIRSVSWGMVGTLADLLLYQVALITGVTQTSGATATAAGKIIFRADRLHEQWQGKFNDLQIKAALQHLKRQGLIARVQGKIYEGRITQEIKQRLEELKPEYREKRIWDKRVYLVSYDIAEIERKLRDKLRSFLGEINCVLLHKSLYLSVYNPRGLLKSWIKNHLKSGEILVSDLGPDGTLGEKPLEELVATAYGLEKLNSRYGEFLRLFPVFSKSVKAKQREAVFCYLSILRDDPQLPFELLPDWWLGDKAWARYNKIIGI